MVLSAGRIASRPRPPETPAGGIGTPILGGEIAATAPPGRSEGGLPRWAALMNWLHTSTGNPPPVIFLVGVLSSLPSQTPVTSWLVKPMNHASRKSWLVPVLPATGQPGRSARRAVPLVIVSCIMAFIMVT